MQLYNGITKEEDFLVIAWVYNEAFYNRDIVNEWAKSYLDILQMYANHERKAAL